MLEPAVNAASPISELPRPAGRGLVRLLFVGLACALAATGASVWGTWLGSEGLPKLAKLEQDLARVRGDNEALVQKLLALSREIVAQKERALVQEALVRDVLGYVRANEIVLQPRPSAKPR